MNNAKLKKRIDDLTKQLANMKTGAGRRPKRKNKPTPVAPTNRSNRSRTKIKSSRAAPGAINIRRSEMLLPVVVKANTNKVFDSLSMNTDNLGYLSTLAKSFENIIWHSARIYWIPAVGTNFNGMITYGADYKFSAKKTTRKNISSFTPSASHPCWCDTTGKAITVPRSNLMSRRMYATSTTGSQDARDQAPFSLQYGMDCDNLAADTTVGEFWMDYSVTLTGTSA